MAVEFDAWRNLLAAENVRLPSESERLMEQLPHRELLDATHQFPCKYTFKMIGAPDDDFVERVVAVVRDVLEHEFDPPFSVRTTASGRHTSVTVEPVVDSSEMVLAVYDRMKNLEGLVMIW